LMMLVKTGDGNMNLIWINLTTDMLEHLSKISRIKKTKFRFCGIFISFILIEYTSLH
jgi:hypothetical protein